MLSQLTLTTLPAMHATRVTYTVSVTSDRSDDLVVGISLPVVEVVDVGQRLGGGADDAE